MLEKLFFWGLAIAFSLFVWWMVFQLFTKREFLTALAVIAFSGFMIAIFYHSKEN